MRKLTRLIASLAVVGLAMAPLLRADAQAQVNQSPLTIMQGDSPIHVLPTVGGASTLAPLLVDTGPLQYNGGPVMLNATTYAIFMASGETTRRHADEHVGILPAHNQKIPG